MTKYFTLIVAFFWMLSVHSQLRYSNTFLDSIIQIKGLDKSFVRKASVKQIASRLSINEQSELQYTILAKWVVNHLNYNLPSKNNSFGSILKSKKGVCWHYAMLLDSLAIYCGFESYLINGKVKEIENGELKFSLHAWNAVRINSTFS